MESGLKAVADRCRGDRILRNRGGVEDLYATGGGETFGQLEDLESLLVVVELVLQIVALFGRRIVQSLALGDELVVGRVGLGRLDDLRVDGCHRCVDRVDLSLEVVDLLLHDGLRPRQIGDDGVETLGLIRLGVDVDFPRCLFADRCRSR